MTQLSKLLIRNMKKYRKEQGLTQFALAELLEVSNETISKIESGQRFPSEKTLDKMIRVFNIEAYQLFVDEEEPFEKVRYFNRIYPLITEDIKKRLKE